MNSSRTVDQVESTSRFVVHCIVGGYLLDWLVRLPVLAHDGAAFQNWARDQNCARWLDQRAICSSYVQYYIGLEGTAMFIKCLLLLIIIPLVCKFKRIGLLEAYQDAWKIFALLQFLSFACMLFYAVFYTMSSQHWSAYSRIIGILNLVVAAVMFSAIEMLRRRLRQLIKRRHTVSAAAYSDKLDCLEEVNYGDIRFVAAYADASCPVCLVDLEQDMVCQLPCRHVFHAACIKEWLKDPSRCQCPLRCAENPLEPTPQEIGAPSPEV